MLVRPDVIFTLADELAVDLDIKTKLPRPVVVPTAVASFNTLLFKVTILIMICLILLFFGFYQINTAYILNIHTISQYLLLLAFLIPTSILFCSVICGLDRKLISLIFPTLVNFTIYGLAIFFFITGILTTITIAFFFNEIQGLEVRRSSSKFTFL